MNKLIIAFCFFAMSVFSYGQEIIVQPTNQETAPTFLRYKNSPEITSAINKLKNVINGNSDYSGKNMSVVVKITFYNRSMIFLLPINRTDVYPDIMLWGILKGNQITLHFVFDEEGFGKDTKITFTKFLYQEGGGSEQVPELVANYIQEEILKKQSSDDVETIVKKGLNAVKNAFDRSFQQKMISNIPPLLPQKKYYKGYSYAGFNWFNFEVVENQDKLPYDLETLYQEDENQNYVLLSEEQSVKSLLDNQSTVFTLYNEEYLKVSETEVSTKGESIYYEEANLLDNSDIHNIYGPAKTEILSNIHTFKELKCIQEPNKKVKTLIYLFNDTENALSQQHKIKVITGEVGVEGEVDEYNGLSWYGKTKFSLNQPTWCNQFVRDLTKNTYFKGEFILRAVSAEYMNNDFNANPTKFENITKTDKNIIWNSYINKGYLVFFSDKGHIEVGFPDNKHYLNMRERHPDDIRYPNTSSNSQSEKKQLTIGAGTTVGYKLADTWATKNSVEKFLYLDYLNYEY